MDLKRKLIQKLQRATSDREDLNRRILRLHRCFREVEKTLNHRNRQKPEG